MSTVAAAKPGGFAAFGVRNFRRFVGGQSVSLVGSWVDTVAQGLLVLQIGGNGVMLGVVVAARYLPVLLLTPVAGLVVDRSNKRHILIGTAIALGLLAGTLAVLVFTQTATLWAVILIALGFGVASALDNPARLAFIQELVEPDLIRNAVSLNSTFVNVGRAVGPLVAAVLVATVGIGWCFVVDALSFVAVLLALLWLRTGDLYPSKRGGRGKRGLRGGLRLAARTEEVLVPLLMMALIGTFTYEFEVSLPLLAKGAFGRAEDYPWLIGAFGVGSVAGGLWNAFRGRTGVRRMMAAAAVFAVAMAATAVAPSPLVAVPLLVVVGFASITFITTGNTTVQLAAPPEYRGRVTALWSTAFLGSTPIGSLIIGTIGNVDARVAVGVGAAACVVAFVVAAILHRVRGGHDAPQPDAQAT